MKRSKSEQIYIFFNYFAVAMFCLSIILPFMRIISISLSNKKAILEMSVFLLPKGFNTAAYVEIFRDIIYRRSLVNSVVITGIITITGLIVNALAAYSLSKEFFGKKVLTYFVIIPMYFYGGLIPYYLLITKYLHLRNTYLALILPGLINVFYIIVLRTQIEGLPQSLIDASRIDGAKEHQVIFYVVLPSILPSMAAIAMFIALYSWNSWFNVMLFTDKKELWTLQYYLRSVINDKSINQSNMGQKLASMTSGSNISSENFQMAAIILVAAPIIMIYPFIQKYFVKGILIGSVKE